MCARFLTNVRWIHHVVDSGLPQELSPLGIARFSIPWICSHRQTPSVNATFPYLYVSGPPVRIHLAAAIIS